MLTVIVTAELEVDFVTWEARYLAHKPVREEAGIEDVFVGKVLNEKNFCLFLLYLPLTYKTRLWSKTRNLWSL